MFRLRFSIRTQLLLGAFATGSIWAGALVQYVNLRNETQWLETVQFDLSPADLTYPDLTDTVGLDFQFAC